MYMHTHTHTHTHRQIFSVSCPIPASFCEIAKESFSLSVGGIVTQDKELDLGSTPWFVLYWLCEPQVIDYFRLDWDDPRKALSWSSCLPVNSLITFGSCQWQFSASSFYHPYYPQLHGGHRHIHHRHYHHDLTLLACLLPLCPLLDPLCTLFFLFQTPSY